MPAAPYGQLPKDAREYQQHQRRDVPQAHELHTRPKAFMVPENERRWAMRPQIKREQQQFPTNEEDDEHNRNRPENHCPPS